MAIDNIARGMAAAALNNPGGSASYATEEYVDEAIKKALAEIPYAEGVYFG